MRFTGMRFTGKIGLKYISLFVIGDSIEVLFNYRFQEGIGFNRFQYAYYWIFRFIFIHIVKHRSWS